MRHRISHLPSLHMRTSIGSYAALPPRPPDTLRQKGTCAILTYHTHCNSGIFRTPTSTTKGSLDRIEPRARCRGKTDSCQRSMLVFPNLRQRSQMICCLVAHSSTALVSNRSHTVWLRREAATNTRQVSSNRVRGDEGRERTATYRMTHASAGCRLCE